jgi:hypothetical protein
MLAHPFRGQIDPTAVSALFDLFFDHLLTEDLEFDTERLITLPFRGSRLSGNFFFFLRNHRVSIPGCGIVRLASHALVLIGTRIRDAILHVKEILLRGCYHVRQNGEKGGSDGMARVFFGREFFLDKRLHSCIIAPL